MSALCVVGRQNIWCCSALPIDLNRSSSVIPRPDAGREPRTAEHFAVFGVPSSGIGFGMADFLYTAAAGFAARFYGEVL